MACACHLRFFNRFRHSTEEGSAESLLVQALELKRSREASYKVRLIFTQCEQLAIGDLWNPEYLIGYRLIYL
jgi:hypothetical protein